MKEPTTFDELEVGDEFVFYGPYGRYIRCRKVSDTEYTATGMSYDGGRYEIVNNQAKIEKL